MYRNALIRPFRPILRRVKQSDFGRRVARSPWFPGNWLNTLAVCRILAIEYGHLKAAAANRSQDAEGQPIPWYTYPAVEFLKQLDFSNCSVFEYGCGQSTLFWSSVAREVVSVEDEESWHAEMAKKIPSNCRLVLQPDLDRFVEAIQPLGSFDVIVIDGPARGLTRLRCARASLSHLQDGGVIVLDNADWLPQSCALLRDSGLLQVDMTGFSPINSFVGTTSFFFDRRWHLPAKGDRRPLPGVGAWQRNWEPAKPAAGKSIEVAGEVLGGVMLERNVAMDMNGQRRTFRVIGYSRSDGDGAIAVVDEDQQRFVLTNHKAVHGPWPGRARELEVEVQTICAMTGDAFRFFINSHPFRRYTLDTFRAQ